MSGASLAPGSRALAVALLLGLVAVLIGRAIWGGGEQTVAPGTPPASTPSPPTSVARSETDSNGLNSLLAGSATGLGDCLNDVAGSPAPPGERQVANQKQFIAILSGQLEKLRELQFRHPVDAEFLTGPKIEKRIGQLIDDEPKQAEESQAGARLLTALGAIEAGDDPEKIERQALKGQVAGLYVPESGELLVRSGKRINVTDTITVVHELDHALTDQALGGIRERFGHQPDASERQSAYTALVEGDATIAMEAYLLRHGGVGDQLDLLDELGPANKAQADLETYPYYFQRQLLFPYLDGLRFGCELYEQGGWKAIDHAYHHPPKTTAEVMFPGRYGEKVPAVGPLPKLDKPWKRQLNTEVGAADLEWLFAAPGDEPSQSLGDPRGAAGAWNGGRVELWSKGKDSAVSMVLRDRARDLRLCHSIGRWYGAFGGTASGGADSGRSLHATFSGPRGQASLSCQGQRVSLGIAPSARLAGKLAAGAN